MAKEKQINYLIASVESGDGLPLDSRQMVSTYSKIFNLYNTYVGMLIYVQFSEDDSKGTNVAGIYVVKAINSFGLPTRVLFIEDYLHISDKVNKPLESPTKDNFASFDENGNMSDSTYNKDSFAPMANAMPLPQLGDEGKILGYEVPTEGANPVVGWVRKPSDGADAYGVYVKQYDEQHPEDPEHQGQDFMSREQWLEYNRGKSAREIYNKEHNTSYTDAQFIEAIKANYPMKYVGYNSTAYSATSPFDSIDSLDADETTEGKLWFMPNNDNTETKLFITVNNGTAENPSYKWYNMGVIDVPSGVLTEDDVDNECTNGAVDKPASANVAMQLKTNLDKKVNRADLSEYEHVVKNLFDKSSFKNGYYVLNLNDGEVANSTGIMSQPLYLNSGTPYIISKIIIGGTGTNRNARLCVYDSNDTLINVKSLPGTVVHEYSASSYYKYEGIVNFVHEQIDNEAYCRIVIQYNANLSATTNYAQLEVGIGEPTEYSEYNSVYGYDFGKGSEVDARIEALEEQVSSNSKEIENFNTIEEGLKYAEGTSIVNSDLEINSAYYYGAVGTTIKTKSASSSFHGKRYIVEGGETYYFSNKFNAGVYSGATPIYGLIFTDSNGSVIARYFLATKNLDEWKDFSIIVPDNAEYAYVNYHSSSVSYTDFLKEIQYGYIDVLGIKEDVDSLKEGSGNTNRSLMKVIIDDNSFVVRTKFSDTEDFAIKFDERILSGSEKDSQSLTLNSYYLGLNTLSDSQLVSSDNKFDNNPDDTISAIAFDGFSAMTGQHGWSIVRVAKNSNILVDSDDIGSIWADKAKPNRTFVLGYITDNYVYFFPEITYNEGTGIYGTTTGNVSTNVPNSFIYVSGEAVHKEEINGTTKRYDLRVETTEWSYLVDGHKVGKGTYYCDDFIFTEKVKGHNPAGVDYQDWFATDNDDRYVNQDFVYLCRSFVFKGSSMTYNLSFNTLYSFKLGHFYLLHPLLPIARTINDKTYHANLFVPKCKGISTPYTNDSGMESGKAYTKYRTSEYLYNVNDLPDRAIAFLQAGENDYNIGMAGGYSLINGCTQKSIRNELLNGLLDNTTTHICQFGNGSSSKNKFYTYALVSSSFEGSIVPTSFVRDFSGYICWFNPNYNPGLQVYTYKDSDCYVVYIHAQSPNDKVAVNLPDYLEGMSVIDTVEKTNGSTLLTDKVSCGKIYVKFEANNGTTYSVNDNYIVLKVR